MGLLNNILDIETTQATVAQRSSIILKLKDIFDEISQRIPNDAGIATMIGGQIQVNSNQVAANSKILLTPQATGGLNVLNFGSVWVDSRVVGVSFIIRSTNVLDTRLVAWFLY